MFHIIIGNVPIQGGTRTAFVPNLKYVIYVPAEVWHMRTNKCR